MVTTKQVSIVLPVYNGGAMISEAISSVFAQHYTNFELIIVNDGSTDDTLDKILAHPHIEDARLRYIRLEENGGLPNALNVGFREALGDYFTWTSHDNSYHPRAIGKMVQALNNNPIAHIVYTDYTQENLNDEGQVVGLWQAAAMPFGQVQYLIESPNVNFIGASFMYTRLFKDSVGEYNTKHFRAEDLDYWLRGLLEFPSSSFWPLNEDLYTYRRHSACLSANEIVCGKAALDVIEEHLERFEQEKYPQLNLALNFMGMCTAAYRYPDQDKLDFFKERVAKYQILAREANNQ